MAPSLAANPPFLTSPLFLLPLPPFYPLSLMLRELFSCGIYRHVWVTLCCFGVDLTLGISFTSPYLSTAGYLTFCLTHFHGFPLSFQRIFLLLGLLYALLLAWSIVQVLSYSIISCLSFPANHYRLERRYGV